MQLNSSINYIVSGIERSGTSMLMQILYNGKVPVSSDDTRKADRNNPKGYFELEGGKIINKLMEGSFPFEKYKGSFIKITAYGLKFLPAGNYKILYSERNIDEVLFSMEKMAKINDFNREETKHTFQKLNEMIKQVIQSRDDCDVLFLNYNDILKRPNEEISKIPVFLENHDADVLSMIRTVDEKLYRNRQKNIA